MNAPTHTSARNAPFPRLLDTPCAAPAPLPAQGPMEAAYLRLRAEMAALPEEDLATINADIPTVVSTIKAALPGLVALRSQVAALPGFDLVAFDKLQDYADALAFVHARARRSEAPPAKLPAMYEEALAFREAVVNVSRGLVSLGLLDASAIPNQGRVQGYRNVGYELMGLCSAMLDQLPRLEGRCPITEDQLVRGKALGNMLIDGLVERAIDQARSTDSGSERARAFTLAVRAYDQARRAVGYLRWDEDDADAIAPSYFARRGRGSRGADLQDAEPALAVDSADEAAALPGAAPSTGTPTGFSAAVSALPARPAGDPLFTSPSSEPFERV